MIQKEFNVTGMTCAACQANVERAVKKLSGVESVSVNLLNENMSVSFDEKEITDDKIINTVISIGYGASLRNNNKDEKSTIRSDWETKQSNEQTKQKLMKAMIIIIISSFQLLIIRIKLLQIIAFKGKCFWKS